jgi:hypothetical protein
MKTTDVIDTHGDDNPTLHAERLKLSAEWRAPTVARARTARLDSSNEELERRVALTLVRGKERSRRDCAIDCRLHTFFTLLVTLVSAGPVDGPSHADPLNAQLLLRAAR